jgi:hypothetical protein
MCERDSIDVEGQFERLQCWTRRPVFFIVLANAFNREIAVLRGREMRISVKYVCVKTHFRYQGSAENTWAAFFDMINCRFKNE